MRSSRFHKMTLLNGNVSTCGSGFNKRDIIPVNENKKMQRKFKVKTATDSHWEEQAALFGLGSTAELLSACSHVTVCVCACARVHVCMFSADRQGGGDQRSRDGLVCCPLYSTELPPPTSHTRISPYHPHFSKPLMVTTRPTLLPPTHPPWPWLPCQ